MHNTYQHPGQAFTQPTPNIHAPCQLPAWQATSHGQVVYLEPTPITITQEVIHRLNGRDIYQALPLGHGWLAVWRGLQEIRHTEQPVVYVAHNCTSSPRQQFPAAAETRNLAQEDECPF